MELIDSRRLTGPNLLADRAGAVIDAVIAPESIDAAVDAWRRHSKRMLDAVGWSGEQTFERIHSRGASLMLTAPVDALYAATEVNEWAFAAAAAELSSASVTAGLPDFDDAVARIKAELDEQRNPALLALRQEAKSRPICFLSDDDHVSVGVGRASRTFAAREVPRLEQVPWDSVYDLPIALVTGTNGKTTTVRLLAAMARAAGLTPGFSSTDGLMVGTESIDQGDYSGPGGARQILRDPRVEVAILETARGGMLRRGLAVDRADVGLVTNVAEDHLGEFGVDDVASIADVKLMLARAAEQLVLNADDPSLLERGVALDVPVRWYSLSRSAAIESALDRGDDAAWLDGERLLLVDDGRTIDLASAAELPLAMSGHARHNLSNALGAALAASLLGIQPEHIGRGLLSFGADPADNPGRLHETVLGTEAASVRVLVDFAHNAHGLDALLDTVASYREGRLLVVLGQAGDRDDASLEALAVSVARSQPDVVVLKHMRDYLRGRPDGEVVGILRATLLRSGVPEAAIEVAETEVDAARRAIEIARPDDVALILSHASRTAVLALVESLRAGDWEPGQPLPDFG